MIDQTPEEIDSIRRLAARQAEIDLCGGIDLFDSERLIPDYITKEYAGFGPAQPNTICPRSTTAATTPPTAA
jgi:hypothetical protein